MQINNNNNNNTKQWYSPPSGTCLSPTDSIEPCSVGDVLSAPFDLCWLHHQGVMKALWVASLFCTAIVWNKTPSDRCCRVCLSARKQLGPVISAHWRWHHLTSVHLTHLPLSGFIYGPWHMLHLRGTRTGKERWTGQGLGCGCRRWVQSCCYTMPRPCKKRGEVSGQRQVMQSLSSSHFDRCDALLQCINSPFFI